MLGYDFLSQELMFSKSYFLFCLSVSFFYFCAGFVAQTFIFLNVLTSHTSAAQVSYYDAYFLNYEFNDSDLRHPLFCLRELFNYLQGFLKHILLFISLFILYVFILVFKVFEFSFRFVDFNEVFFVMPFFIITFSFLFTYLLSITFFSRFSDKILRIHNYLFFLLFSSLVLGFFYVNMSYIFALMSLIAGIQIYFIKKYLLIFFEKNFSYINSSESNKQITIMLILKSFEFWIRPLCIYLLGIFLIFKVSEHYNYLYFSYFLIILHLFYLVLLLPYFVNLIFLSEKKIFLSFNSAIFPLKSSLFIKTKEEFVTRIISRIFSILSVWPIILGFLTFLLLKYPLSIHDLVKHGFYIKHLPVVLNDFTDLTFMKFSDYFNFMKYFDVNLMGTDFSFGLLLGILYFLLFLVYFYKEIFTNVSYFKELAKKELNLFPDILMGTTIPRFNFIFDQISSTFKISSIIYIIIFLFPCFISILFGLDGLFGFSIGVAFIFSFVRRSNH